MVRLGPLLPDYKNIVCEWQEEYLSELLSCWGKAYGSSMSNEDIKFHIDNNRLCDGEWQELINASNDDFKFVSCALEENELVGVVYAELREDRYFKIKLGVISWIYVRRDQRRKGISKKLLSEAKKWMKDNNASATEVFVTIKNTPAVNAYKSARYRVIDYRMIKGL